MMSNFGTGGCFVYFVRDCVLVFCLFCQRVQRQTFPQVGRVYCETCLLFRTLPILSAGGDMIGVVMMMMIGWGYGGYIVVIMLINNSAAAVIYFCLVGNQTSV